MQECDSQRRGNKLVPCQANTWHPFASHASYCEDWYPSIAAQQLINCLSYLWRVGFRPPSGWRAEGKRW